MLHYADLFGHQEELLLMLLVAATASTTGDFGGGFCFEQPLADRRSDLLTERGLKTIYLNIKKQIFNGSKEFKCFNY